MASALCVQLTLACVRLPWPCLLSLPVPQHSMPKIVNCVLWVCFSFYINMYFFSKENIQKHKRKKSVLCRVVLIKQVRIKITVGHVLASGAHTLKLQLDIWFLVEGYLSCSHFLSLSKSVFITVWRSDIGLVRKHFLKLCAPLLAFV